MPPPRRALRCALLALLVSSSLAWPAAAPDDDTTPFFDDLFVAAGEDASNESPADPPTTRVTSRVTRMKDTRGLDSSIVPHSAESRVMRVQDSAPFTDGEATRAAHSDKAHNVTNLEDFFDLFNPFRFGLIWEKPESVQLSNRCNRTLHQYFEGLKKTEKWAVKMWDATGRHGTGFFWGNTYWTGSKTACDYVTDAPFATAFNLLKLVTHLPHHLKTSDDKLHLGVCLPYACTEEDVRSLAQVVLKQDNVRLGQLTGVRTPHNPYNFWEDSVFWILVAVSILITILLIAGTTYDYYLSGGRKTDLSKVLQKTSEFTSASTLRKSTLGNGKIYSETVQTIDQLCSQLYNNNNGIKNFNFNHVDSNGNTQTSTTEKSEKNSPSKLEGALLAFSLRVNLRTICDREVGSDTIPIIHGLRFLSMVWVVLGHTCIVAFKYSDNMSYRGVMESNFLFQTITNATFSVDTFFFISGLLVSFLYFRTVNKVDINSITKTTGFKSSVLQFLGLLGYRYCRLTVPYMFVLGAVQISMKWFHYNSLFEPPTLDHVNCPNYWWRNALYINTLFPVKDMCMLWSWYLADDTQFYILGSVLLILATSYFRFAAVIMTTFLASSWCTTAFIAFSNKHLPSVDDPLALFDKIYDKPWTRLGPYLIGMCVGWLLYKKDCKIRMNKITIAVGWLGSSGLLLYLVYGLFNVDLHPIAGAIYSSLSHTLWAMALAWIVIACCTGYGGYVNKLLSMTILYPFSRVTYCAYLVHPIIIRIIPMKMDAPIHLTKETVAMLFLGQLVASYIVAFIVSIAFEAPVVSLLKVVSPVKKDAAKAQSNK